MWNSLKALLPDDCSIGLPIPPPLGIHLLSVRESQATATFWLHPGPDLVHHPSPVFFFLHLLPKLMCVGNVRTDNLVPEHSQCLGRHVPQAWSQEQKLSAFTVRFPNWIALDLSSPWLSTKGPHFVLSSTVSAAVARVGMGFSSLI